MNIARHRPKPSRIGCQHRFTTKATGVHACIVLKDGAIPFLGSEESKGPNLLVTIPRRYLTLEFCSSPTCERVFYAEEE